MLRLCPFLLFLLYLCSSSGHTHATGFTVDADLESVRVENDDWLQQNKEARFNFCQSIFKLIQLCNCDVAPLVSELQQYFLMEFMVRLQIFHLSVWELREAFVHIPSEEGLS